MGRSRASDNISNNGRPNEFKYWMLGIVFFCMSGFIASIFPTFGSFIDYFFVSIIVAGFLWLVIYAVTEVIKEKRFWNSKPGDKDYNV